MIEHQQGERVYCTCSSCRLHPTGTTAPEVVVDATRVFVTGATRDTDDNKLAYEGFLSPVVLRAYAEYMHRCRTRNVPPGAVIRAADNWQKGIPRPVYMDSLVRHLMDAWREHRLYGRVLNEDLLGAIMFNVMGYWLEQLKEDSEGDVS